MAFIEKGKSLTHERMEVIRFADRKGWSAGLRYLGDDIAETEAKAMRKSKKDVEGRAKDGPSRSDRRCMPYTTTRLHVPSMQYPRELAAPERGENTPAWRPDTTGTARVR